MPTPKGQRVESLTPHIRLIVLCYTRVLLNYIWWKFRPYLIYNIIILYVYKCTQVFFIDIAFLHCLYRARISVKSSKLNIICCNSNLLELDHIPCVPAILIAQLEVSQLSQLQSRAVGTLNKYQLQTYIVHKISIENAVGALNSLLPKSSTYQVLHMSTKIMSYMKNGFLNFERNQERIDFTIMSFHFYVFTRFFKKKKELNFECF